MARWILLREDGSVAAQVVTTGKERPTFTGDNPDGLKEVEVRRHGDLQHEHWDTERGRWVSDKALKARAERRAALRDRDRGEFREDVMAEIDALRARVAALEGART